MRRRRRKRGSRWGQQPPGAGEAAGQSSAPPGRGRARRGAQLGQLSPGFSPPEAGAVSRNFAARLCWRAQGSLHGEGGREPRPSRVTCFICVACVNAQRRCSAAHMLTILHRCACQDVARCAAPRPSVPTQMFEVNKHGMGSWSYRGAGQACGGHGQTLPLSPQHPEAAQLPPGGLERLR